MRENPILKKQNIARDLIKYLQNQQGVNSCTIHGSLSCDMGDVYSDIDLQIDVSGKHNGKMVLMLPYIVQQRFPLAYIAFAPKFAPDLYLVSLALSQTSIFNFIDIECLAMPHVPSLQRDDIRQITNWTSLHTKLLK